MTSQNHSAPLSRRRALFRLLCGSSASFVLARTLNGPKGLATARAFAGNKHELSMPTPAGHEASPDLIAVLDTGLFLAVWRAAYGHTAVTESGTLEHAGREQAFRRGLRRVLSASPTELLDELKLVARVLSLAPGRWLLCGIWQPVEQVAPERLALALEEMSNSRLTIRRKVAMGLLIVIGMSHYSEPELYADAGYPGPPKMSLGLWHAHDREPTFPVPSGREAVP